MKNVVEKYTAIKVKGFSYWIWFEDEKITDENGKFVGKAGWGKGGAFTNIEIDRYEIVGLIKSDTLQYT